MISDDEGYTTGSPGSTGSTGSTVSKSRKRDQYYFDPEQHREPLTPEELMKVLPDQQLPGQNKTMSTTSKTRRERRHAMTKNPALGGKRHTKKARGSKKHKKSKTSKKRGHKKSKTHKKRGHKKRA